MTDMDPAIDRGELEDPATDLPIDTELAKARELAQERLMNAMEDPTTFLQPARDSSAEKSEQEDVGLVSKEFGQGAESLLSPEAEKRLLDEVKEAAGKEFLAELQKSKPITTNGAHAVAYEILRRLRNGNNGYGEQPLKDNQGHNMGMSDEVQDTNY